MMLRQLRYSDTRVPDPGAKMPVVHCQVPAEERAHSAARAWHSPIQQCHDAQGRLLSSWRAEAAAW